MQTVDLIIQCQFIVTANEDDHVFKDHCLVVDAGKILAILPNEQQQYCSEHCLDRKQHALMPGLINCHGHAAMTLLRGFADDLALDNWLQEHIWPAEAQWVNEQFVEDGTNLAIAEMLLSGTTCFSDHYFFPHISAECSAKAGIRAQIACPILDFATNWADSAEQYLNKTNTLIEQYQQHPLASIAYGPHAPYSISDEPLMRIHALSTQSNSAVQMHIHETCVEVEQAVLNTGIRPLQRLNELGLVNSQLQAVHMTELTNQEIELLAQQQSSVIHCPQSNMKLASGHCPVDALINAGVNVALGTDGAASNNGLDMFCEMKSASLLSKANSNNPKSVAAAQAIKMATINGANALGIGRLTGSIEIGKAADLCALNLSFPHCQPIYNILSQIVYACNSSQISDVWVDGEQLVDNKHLTQLDLPYILQQAKYWQGKISNR